MSETDVKTHCISNAMTSHSVVSEESDLLVQLQHSRAGYASHVTRNYNEFMKADEENQSVVVLHEISKRLVDAFAKFDVANKRYLERLEMIDPAKTVDVERQFNEIESQVRMARCRIIDVTKGAEILNEQVLPYDSVSVAGSHVSSTSSARVKVAARRAVLEAKLNYQKRQQELEEKFLLQEHKRKEERLKMEAMLEVQSARDARELDQLKLEAEYQAAVAEEQTLAEFDELKLSNPDDKIQVHGTDKPILKLPANMNNHKIVNQQVSRDDSKFIGSTVCKESDLNPMAEEWKNTKDMKSSSSKCEHSTESNIDFQQRLIDAMCLPKTSIKPFDGDPLNFASFMQAFDSIVDGTSVDDSVKLNCLFEYCTGKALKVIQACALMNPAVGYVRARKLLIERFGNAYQISEAWIQKVTEGPSIKPNSKEALQNFTDDIRCCVETLRALNMLSEIDSRLRMVRILDRVPHYIQGRWRKFAVDTVESTGHYPDIECLLTFLERVSREANDPVFGLFNDSKSYVKSHPKGRGVSLQIDTSAGSGGKKTGAVKFQKYNRYSKPFDDCNSKPKDSPAHECYICRGGHILRNCDRFLQCSPSERFDVVKGNRLCFNCLESRNHSAKWCRKPKDCNVKGCHHKHSRLLHDVFMRNMDKQHTETTSSPGPAKQVLKVSDVPKTPKTEEAQTYTCRSLDDTTAGIALPIVAVWVKGPDQEDFILTQALLDSGSNRSFCSLKLAERLGLCGEEMQLNLQTLNKTNELQACVVSLDITGTGRFKRNGIIHLPRVFAVEDFPELTSTCIDDTNIRRWSHTRDIPVSANIKRTDVNILIGQDIPRALIPLEVRYGRENEPYATRTILGWTLNGPLGEDVTDDQVISNFICEKNDTEVNLEDKVERFWKLDSHLVTAHGDATGMSVDDKHVVDIWKESVTTEDGHYVLDIPFKQENSDLPDNKVMAQKRLNSLGRRLSQNEDLRTKYQQEMNKMIEKGFVEKVPLDEIDGPPGSTWYIPHHNVFNPKKPEKFRIVFDCAAQFAGTSLNQNVFRGPDLTNKLIGVLLRFRENHIALMGDIEGMFLQVKVSPRHRDALRFLRWKDGDPTLKPEVFRMTRHLFGGVWCPSCASYALRCTVDDNRNEFPSDVTEAVKDNFFVDDCLLSVEDETTAIRVRNQLCSLLSRGGFRLTKWLSNSRTVVDEVPENDRIKQLKSVDLNLGSSLPMDRALGIHWDAEADKLGLEIKPESPKCTKRAVLSLMSSVYDPLGFVGPCVLLAKKIFQDECRLEKGWDEPLHHMNQQKWLKWVEHLPLLQVFQIERCLIPDTFSEIVEAELHHFCDASKDAYGAVSYLRLTNKDNEVHCSFLMGKSRLAPIKQVTIPRLELLGAVVAVQMDTLLKREMRIKIKSSTFWTDSMIILQYILNKNRRFHTFVANRIALIHEGSNPSQWRHVDTHRNPADHASRGLEAAEMVKCALWSKGPAFLWEDKDTWPSVPEPNNQLLKDDKEVKKEVTSCILTVQPHSELFDHLLTHYSSWNKLKRAVSWLIRFVDWIRHGRKNTANSKNVKLSDLQRAEKVIVHHVQHKCYHEELEILKSDKHIAEKNPLYQLEPFCDEKGLLRVGGRLRAAQMASGAIHPLIMPSYHHVTNLIVQDIHERSFHSGREHLLSLIRQTFWIPKARPFLRKILKKCVVCRRMKSEACGQRMADLPYDRVAQEKPPFTYVGLDCFGPFFVKRGRSQEKRYGLLFTCLTIRAIHIEKLHSMDSDAFINAFIRFVSRRGRPELVRSDNGTNFVGGEKEINEAIRKWNDNPKVMNMLLVHQVEWKFNPPVAPHMGGAWERQIQTVKKVMNTVLKNQVLDDERLDTLFCEAESVVNGRPLTHLSDDPNDYEVLTPNHLLQLRASVPLVATVTKKEDCYGRRWRHVQLLADMFWKRWVKEYLVSLQFRSKWISPKPNLKEDDVVIIADEATPRRSWPLGRVTKVNVSSDGLVRSVEVKTGSNLLVRPVHKLHLLESTQENG